MKLLDFELLPLGLLPYATVPVGYGGLIYDILNIGNIISLKVLPAPNETATNDTATATTPTTSQIRNLTSIT